MSSYWTRSKVVALTAAVVPLMLLPVHLSAAGQSAGAKGALEDPVEIALEYLERSVGHFGVRRADVADLAVASSYKSSHNRVTHVNLNQRFGDLEVFGAYATVNVAEDGEVLFVGDSLVKGLSAATPAAAPQLDARDAVTAAAKELDLDDPDDLRVISGPQGRAQETVLSKAEISSQQIPARLGWHPAKGGLRLAWQLTIDDSSDSHLWNATIDADTGELLKADDWTDHHSAKELASTLARGSTSSLSRAALTSPDPVDDGSSYRVFELSKESPSDGPRTLVNNPADATASPFGWHDTDGVEGPELTITRGNNVHAYTDRDANNVADPGSDPDGSSDLDFDFSVDLDEHAYNYSDGAVTNLFHWNNVIHDVMYGYGFDEASGNFQANNYGRGGTGTDYVRAEAQDGSGDNNANFSTPVETPTSGGTPRMQMFLWPGLQFGLPNAVTVTSGPAAGTYLGHFARFTPAPTTAGLSGDIALVNDGSGTVTDGCQPYILPSGSIALVDRSSSCNFFERATIAESAGAGAVIVANNLSSSPAIMAGSMNPPVGIPALMISRDDGTAIKAGLPATGRVHRNTNRPPMRDGDLDNGIIIHEYGHGISNRLTGGPTVNCLTGNEQAGEGWSDFFAITMLLDPALDDPERPRGMGPYALFQDSRQGNGIRPRPYSRNMAIQPFTYDSIKTRGWLEGKSLALPHGLGHGWAAVLWDVTWDLIDKHGFNSDAYGEWDTGGNNRALQYVIDGLKFQGCAPGLVVARDAIIAAADELSDGEDTCTVWASFARRGLGFSAVQGTTNRNDNIEAFDTHPDCRQGFLGGVSDPPTVNTVNRGSTVPLSFSLGGDRGLDILASNSPYSRRVNCETLRTETPGAEFITPRPLPIETQTPGNSGLKYDRGQDRYKYPWKTLKEWAGTCRELVVTRTDGVQHRAYFRFTPSAPPPEPPPVARVWEARHNGSGNGGDYGWAMDVSPDGSRVYVTGMSDGDGTAQDFATVAYDASTGERLWISTYDGPASSTDDAAALEVSPDGSRVYVSGRSIGEGRTFSGMDYATVSYDAATGEELWVKRYDGPGNDQDDARALSISPDGSTVFVTGESRSGSSFVTRDYATVAYGAATGEELWVARYNGPGNNLDAARALGVSPDGSSVFVTGESNSGSFGTGSYATVAYDADTGAERWAVRYDGPGNSSDGAHALGVSPDGARVFVTGESAGASTGTDYATVGYDADTGEEHWAVRYDGPASSLDQARALGVSPDGARVFVTGQSFGTNTSADYATVGYDTATGEERWAARYDGPASSLDEAAALGVSPDGTRVYVTGYSDGGGASTDPHEGYDFATLAYGAATGDEHWLARYDSPARHADGAEALTVSPDGVRIFLTGQSVGVGTGADYATVMYEQLDDS